MARSYRAVVVSDERRPRRETVIAGETDFDAFLTAKQVLGSSTHFDLWEGDRRALIYRPNQEASALPC